MGGKGVTMKGRKRSVNEWCTGMESYLCFHLLLIRQLDFERDVAHEVVVDDGNVVSPVDFELVVPVATDARCVCKDDLVAKGVFSHGVRLQLPEE